MSHGMGRIPDPGEMTVMLLALIGLVSVIAWIASMAYEALLWVTTPGGLEQAGIYGLVLMIGICLGVSLYPLVVGHNESEVDS